jgi:peptidoglycan/xylan/chitin deacetylase (PgdA/CDA1 family)
MRRDKVFRFVATAFAVGAFIGLICGLAFGGSGGAGTARAAVDDTTTSTVAVADDTSLPSEPMTEERARAIGANELGQVLVVMYHLIDSDVSQSPDWTRTPEEFRNDMALLKAEGYYPVNVRDLAAGNIDIPAGKSPVVITFDDSSPGQYRILDDGSTDPDCAVGIMQQAVEAGGWASRASFFVLLDVVPKERELFGQEKQREKLRNLVDWGYEIGSHTVTHLDLKKASTDEAKKQLAQSQATLEELIGGGYQITSLSVPFGNYPSSDDILKSGTHNDITYAYDAAVSIAARPSPSPFSAKFDPFHIPRIRGGKDQQTGSDYLKAAIQNFKNHPELRYISDGDPTTVSAPKTLDTETLGELRGDLGRPVVRY